VNYVFGKQRGQLLVESIEEFLEIDKISDEYLEYIDGQIYYQASPFTIHQRISVNFTAEFRSYFKAKQCEILHAPFDVRLKNEKEENQNKVIPDITVICDKSGLNDKNYIGVPSLIVEILSPSNQSHDLITKMNLYQRFGVKEYWIVNPKLNSIQIYALDNEGLYEQVGVYKDKDTAKSSVFPDLRVSLEEIFS
jgi:Uma2 family endonuclease